MSQPPTSSSYPGSLSIWQTPLATYTPPRGPCQHKTSLLNPACACLRFMLHPLKATTSFACDGCGHHASFHRMKGDDDDDDTNGHGHGHDYGNNNGQRDHHRYDGINGGGGGRVEEEVVVFTAGGDGGNRNNRLRIGATTGMGKDGEGTGGGGGGGSAKGGKRKRNG